MIPKLLSLNKATRTVNSGNNKITLLNNIDLQVKEGEFISLMGPSGSGKSTLLNCIGMLDSFTNGSYTFLGEPVHSMKQRSRTKLYQEYIGFVFQAYHLIDHLNVWGNIETPLLYKNIKSLERKALVVDMLDHFNIVGKKDLFPIQLSGGQQQLIGIARALIGKPRLILADEPTGNLNSKQSTEIMELFSQLNKDGVTIIQATHSKRNASYGSRIVSLLDGKIVEE